MLVYIQQNFHTRQQDNINDSRKLIVSTSRVSKYSLKYCEQVYIFLFSLVNMYKSKYFFKVNTFFFTLYLGYFNLSNI